MSPDNIRVLHVVGSSKFGGEASVILHLALLARSLGWGVEVLAGDQTAVRYYSQHDMQVIPLDVIHRPISPVRDLVDTWRVYRFLRARRYDIVHTHTSKGGVIGRVAARLAGVPVIVHTVHGFAFHEQSPRWQLALYASIERIAARFCSQLVTVSNYHRRWALSLRIGDPEQTRAIPNGITPAEIAPAIARDCVRISWGVAPEEMVIIAIGRLAEQKGLEYLIRAAPRIAEALDGRVHVLLAGCGELEVSLKHLTRALEVQDCVRFLGFQQDVGSLLGAADIVASPSLWEGMSISLLEAMAAAKPIVATAIGSNLEVLQAGESALIVPPRDPLALADALIVLARDPALRARLASAALAAFQERYTAEHMVQAYRDLYRRLLTIKGPRPNE